MVKTYARVAGGSLADFAKEIEGAGAIAVTAGITAAGQALKASLTDDVRAAALGEKLGRAIKLDIYPRNGASLGTAAVVRPNGRRAERIFEAWNVGATITPTGGRKWLAIPTAKAGHGVRGSLMTPQKFVDATGIKLRFVPTKKPKVALLVGSATAAKSGRGFRKDTRGRRRQGRAYRDEVFFVLIRQTEIPSRLHFEAIAKAIVEQIPSLIEQELG